jgi:hypothetical protein
MVGCITRSRGIAGKSKIKTKKRFVRVSMKIKILVGKLKTKIQK